MAPALVETTPGELSAPVAAPAIEIEVSGGGMNGLALQVQETLKRDPHGGD